MWRGVAWRGVARQGKAWQGKVFESTEIMNKNAPVHIRWMLRRDLPEVLWIESAAFEFPWSKADFIRCLRHRNCIGIVAEDGNQVVGFMVYALQRTRIHFLNFAVHPAFRRLGVGRQMVAHRKAKLSEQRRTRITLEVRERNLDAQLFFRSMGFRAVNVLHYLYHDSPEDAIVFSCNLGRCVQTAPAHNR